MDSELLWSEMQEMCQGDTELMQEIIDTLQSYVWQLEEEKEEN